MSVLMLYDLEEGVLFLVSNPGGRVLGHAAAIAGNFGYIMYVYIAPPLGI